MVGGYHVDVTPLGLEPVAGSDFSGSNPWVQPSRDIMARFVVTAVPEPATYVGGLSALVLPGLFAWRRRTLKPSMPPIKEPEFAFSPAQTQPCVSTSSR